MQLFAAKLTEKNLILLNPSKAKEYYNSYLKKKEHKISKSIESNYPATKSYRKQNSYRT